MFELDNKITGSVDSSDAVRTAYSRDASMFQVIPKAVIRPRTIKDVEHVVQYVSEQKKKNIDISIAPRNGGTCMSGGSLTEDYVLDMSRYLHKVGAVDTMRKQVRVQGGAMHRDVESHASQHGLLFAPYTSSKDICGIGGMIGNNASGEMSLMYGPTSSNVNSLQVVVSDGNAYEFGELTRQQLYEKMHQPTFEGHLYKNIVQLLEDNRHLIERHHPRVAKNAAGYALWDIWDQPRSRFNLSRLFVGSQGTLGIVTEATLKLVDKNKHEQMIVCAIDSMQDLSNVVQTMVRRGACVCETFDYHTYELAQQKMPEAAQLAHFANGKHMVVMGIFAGDSKDAAVIAAGACKDILEQQLHQAVRWIENEAEQHAYLAIRRASFKLLKEMDSRDFKAMPFIEDTIVPLEHYGEFVSALEAILEDYNMTYTYAGHIGQGSIRLIPLVDRSGADTIETIFDLETRVNELVLAFGGSISVDHNDGIIRTPYLERQYGPEMMDLFRRVKQLFDPLGIFNPGKKIDGTLQYAKDHIALY